MAVEKETVKQVMDELSEKTDMMFNAIKVNEFEIFENNLQRREALLTKFSELKCTMDLEELQFFDVSSFLKNMLMINKKIDHELKRFHKELEKDLIRTRTEKNNLNKNKKKTNQYQLKTNATFSGNYFDKIK